MMGNITLERREMPQTKLDRLPRTAGVMTPLAILMMRILTQGEHTMPVMSQNLEITHVVQCGRQNLPGIQHPPVGKLAHNKALQPTSPLTRLRV